MELGRRTLVLSIISLLILVTNCMQQPSLGPTGDKDDPLRGENLECLTTTSSSMKHLFFYPPSPEIQRAIATMDRPHHYFTSCIPTLDVWVCVHILVCVRGGEWWVSECASLNVPFLKSHLPSCEYMSTPVTLQVGLGLKSQS